MNIRQLISSIPFQLLTQDIRIAFAFLTRIPLSYPLNAQGQPVERTLAAASWAFPLVGLIVGLTGALILTLSDLLHFPALVSALLAITGTILVTGALHEDGLADVADGFGGSHERDRKLEIMKDSQVGSYGVLALCLSLLLRTALIAGLIDFASMDQEGAITPNAAAAVVIAAHIIARGYLPLMMSHLPLARRSGLAAQADKPKLRSSYAAFLICLILAGSLLPFTMAVLAIFLSLLATALFSWLSFRQIGGYSGDVLGSTAQLCEIAVYIAALAYIT
ncbi:adenosylcobinamide-GDP ribazoletransferase [Kiloniella laminariae]|uniref:Adenosylcobinamide-GDP ribazoletransferase n=1 Tax=Kiloniella laminariae TaxID=454162 RepID=A0ABT4LIL8_9PROT|nr:adenosylcobinamide-GDP ribazoletransferase [Kiloniella laminariae]MCZ4280960.1 adenosylcobinamide-GDP ribazoletransferase [Kiloniella laminariae]